MGGKLLFCLISKTRGCFTFLTFQTPTLSIWSCLSNGTPTLTPTHKFARHISPTHHHHHKDKREINDLCYKVTQTHSFETFTVMSASSESLVKTTPAREAPRSSLMNTPKRAQVNKSCVMQHLLWQQEGPAWSFFDPHPSDYCCNFCQGPAEHEVLAQLSPRVLV